MYYVQSRKALPQKTKIVPATTDSKIKVQMDTIDT